MWKTSSADVHHDVSSAACLAIAIREVLCTAETHSCHLRQSPTSRKIGYNICNYNLTPFLLAGPKNGQTKQTKKSFYICFYLHHFCSSLFWLLSLSVHANLRSKVPMCWCSPSASAVPTSAGCPSVGCCRKWPCSPPWTEYYIILNLAQRCTKIINTVMLWYVLIYIYMLYKGIVILILISFSKCSGSKRFDKVLQLQRVGCHVGSADILFGDSRPETKATPELSNKMIRVPTVNLCYEHHLTNNFIQNTALICACSRLLYISVNLLDAFLRKCYVFQEFPCLDKKCAIAKVSPHLRSATNRRGSMPSSRIQWLGSGSCYLKPSNFKTLSHNMLWLGHVWNMFFFEWVVLWFASIFLIRKKNAPHAKNREKNFLPPPTPAPKDKSGQVPGTIVGADWLKEPSWRRKQEPIGAQKGQEIVLPKCWDLYNLRPGMQKHFKKSRNRWLKATVAKRLEDIARCWSRPLEALVAACELSQSMVDPIHLALEQLKNLEAWSENLKRWLCLLLDILYIQYIVQIIKRNTRNT